MTAADDRFEILAVVDRYATALDRRDWKLLDQVFTEDVHFDSGEWLKTSRAEYVEIIRTYLGGCGPTQHLLGNHRIELLGDAARAACYVRAFHRGSAELSELTYDMGGEYRDVLRRTPDGWRIHHRTLEIFFEEGTREVLRPAV